MTLTLVPSQKPLTPRELIFIEEIIKGENQATAYVRAGFAKTGANGNAARLIARDSIRSEIERRRSAVMVKLEKSTIATLGEVKERLTQQLRGDDFADEIKAMEAKLSEFEGAAQFSALAEIVRLKLAMSTEAGRAAERLARLKGALDPSRKPLPDRKAALDALMMTLVKSTDGHTLAAQMRAVGFTDVGV